MRDPEPPAPEELVVRAGSGDVDVFRHPLNPASESHLRRLAYRAGLRRVGVDHVKLPPAKESGAFHLHHAEEEFMFVLAGRGVAEVGEERFEIGPGDFLGFPPETHAHHTRNAGEGELLYVVGGESRPVEVVDYPRHGFRSVRTGENRTRYPVSAGELVSVAPAPPLPEPRRLLFTASERAALPEEHASHPMNPRCEVHGFSLGVRTGLRRIGVNLVRIPPGKDSSILHLHHVEEEFAYVVSGRGAAELGDARIPIGPGDFVGFPPATLAHVLVNDGAEDLVVLAGGERRAVEVADFPREGKRLVKVRAGAMVYPIAGERLTGG